MKIKVKLKDPRRSPSDKIREEIMKICTINEVYITHLADLKDGYVVFTPGDTDLPKLLSREVEAALADQGLEVVLPPEVKAMYTLVLKKVDRFTFNYTNEEIISEIKRAAPFAKQKISDIYQMKVHSILKIKFKDIKTAERIKKNGITLFYTTNLPVNIENEKFIPIKQCMKCFSYEHTRFECKVKSVICSECVSKYMSGLRPDQI